ncbi:hypothetical protein RUND412_007948 [Rhizina undulata]
MLSLTLTADLDGVTTLAPIDTPSAPHYYTFTIQCTSCREIHPNPVSFTRFEEHDLPSSRGIAHLTLKCRNCTRDSSVIIKTPPSAYAATSPAKAASILTLECRGCDLVSFHADGEWGAKNEESGTEFTDIDLSSGEWYEYDEKAGCEVSIKDVNFEIKKA